MNQLFIIAQKRTGSTLLLRILNQIPGFSIAGENGGAFLHLAKFYHQIVATRSKRVAIDTYVENITKTKPCWLNPWIKDTDRIRDHLRDMMQDMYAVYGARIWGFKEIRYGRNGENYDEFVDQLSFLRILFPNSKLIFLTREMESLIRSNRKRPPKGRNLTEDELSRLLKLQFAHFQKFLLEYPENALGLSYEDIRDQTPRFREDLFAFLGVPLLEAYLKPLAKDL